MNFGADTIPDVMKYSKTMKTIGYPSKLVKREYVTEANSIFNNNNTQIVIPIAGNFFVDTNRSYFEATVTFTPTGGSSNNTYALDNSIYSLFKLVKVENTGGGEIEELSFYNEVVNGIADANLPKDVRSTAGAFSGFWNPGHAPSTATTQEAAVNNSLLFPGDTSTSKTFRFSLPCSGLMNITSSYHNGGVLLPLALVKGIKVTLQLNNAECPFVNVAAGTTAATAVSWTISNVKYVAIGTEFDSSMVAQLKQSVMAASNDPNMARMLISSYTYRNDQRTITGNGDKVLQLPVRARSLKSLFIMPRVQTEGSLANRAISKMGRTYDNFKNLQLNINSQLYPSQPISTVPALYSELNNALGGVADGIIDLYSYTQNHAAGNTTANSGSQVGVGRFIAGIDLESVQDVVLNGYDNKTNSIPIDLRFNVSTTVPTNETKTITTAAMCDMDLLFDLTTGTIIGNF